MTPWGETVLLEKMVKKFPTFMELMGSLLITMFTTACQWTIPQLELMQYINQKGGDKNA
jgi:hypothetical protein